MANPHGSFSGKKSHMVMAGRPGDSVYENARNFGYTRTGAFQTSGSGMAPTPSSLSGAGYRRGAERLFGADGQINASDDRELIQKIGALLNGSQQRTASVGDKRKGQPQGPRLFERKTTDEYARHLQVYEHALRVAATDGTGQGHRIIGEVLGDEVYETLGRESFAPVCLMFRELDGKEVGRVRVRKKDVTAQISTTNITTNRTMVRQFYVYPSEYYITASASIEEKELAQAGGEILDEKYQDLLEQVLVQQDTRIKTQFDATVGVFNPLVSFVTFTPTFFTQAKINIDHWGIPCTRAVMAWDLWNDISAQAEFANWFDPVTKHEMILDGRLGSLMDVQLITDALRYDTLRVLNDGEIYFLGPASAVGVILQRKALQANPTDRYNFGQPERGWYLVQIQSDAVFPRAVSKAQRVIN